MSSSARFVHICQGSPWICLTLLQHASHSRRNVGLLDNPALP